MDLYLERFDIRQMLEETVSTVRPLVEKNQNEFVTDFPDDIGGMRADLTKVRQSVVNLLSNAAKFTEGGHGDAGGKAGAAHRKATGSS